MSTSNAQTPSAVVHCVGCGIAARGQHPYVGIGRTDPRSDDSSQPLTAHPVCADCYRDPAHRTLGALKTTFFAADQAGQALSAARATDRQSKAGLDIGIGTATI